jgi:hypothetical protein
MLLSAHGFRMTRLVAGGCLSALALAAAGCSTAPVLGGQHTLAFGASPSDLANGGCVLQGEPRVVAGHVLPEAGVSSVATEGGGIQLLFATARRPHAALTVDPGSLQITEVGDAPAAAQQSHTGQGEAGPRGVVAWTEGRPERGLNVKVATVEGAVATVATPDLGYEGTAVSAPTVASTRDGEGVFAFIESNGVTSQLVVVRAACAAR